MGSAICGGGIPRRRIMWCPTCGQRRRFACTLALWYGEYATCCTCGDQWCDAEMLPRPFARGWRKDSAARAREAWRNALTPSEFKAAVHAEIEAIRADSARQTEQRRPAADAHVAADIL